MGRDEKIIKALLVDDELAFLESTAKALKRRGLEIVTAASGQEARQALLSHDDLTVAVLDVKLPDIDGYELFRQIKDDRPEIEIIMLTGHGSVSKAFELSKKGVFDYLSKPCSIEYLEKIIRDAYHASRSGKQGASNSSANPLDRLIRVLFVDDEKEFIDSMTKILVRRGLQVTKAYDGAAALEVIREKPIDVAVVDIKMPGIGGIELLARIKEEKPLVEVIILTGHGAVDTALKGLKQGAFDYLHKPQEAHELIAKITEAAEKKYRAEEKLKEENIKDIVGRLPS